MQVSEKLFPVSKKFDTATHRAIASYNVSSKKFADSYADFYQNHSDECKKALRISLASQDKFENGLILGITSKNVDKFLLITLKTKTIR